MRPTNSEEKSIGYYLSKELDLFHLDFGIRYDQIGRNGSRSHKEHQKHEEEIEFFDRDIKNISFAFSLGKDINDFWNINFGLARVQRAPSAVEFSMNGPHLATGRFEVGDPNLKSEASNNIDLTFNYEKEGFFGVFTFFKNDVDNYIYLLDETEDEHDKHHEDNEHEGLILSNYLQKDAQFSGLEFEFGKIFELERGDLSLSFGRDSVSGEFKNERNIPRMMPARNIYSMSYSEDDLEFKLTLQDVEDQKDIGLNETATNGHEMLNVSLKKIFNLSNQNELNVSVFTNNLLDEVARNHTSFVKDQVPLSGRNYGIKLNFIF